MDSFQSPVPSSRKDKADPGSMSVTIPASPFMQKLGYGTGVSVYLMKRSPQGLSRSPWAVKKIYSGCSRSQRSLYQQRLQEEAKTLRNLQHPNIVGQHGDIKSPNVVVKGAFESVKICDVGMSLPLDENLTVSDPELCYVGTEPWKPREALEPGGIISDRSDIFAFGLTLWEMLTLSIPHLRQLDMDTDTEGSFSEDSFDEDSYYAALGTRPPLPAELLAPSHGSIVELFSVCTAELPAKRPPAARIVEVLEQSQPCPQ
ncbi:lymphokine-activated killer T-cell-originated protein kinase [Malurus melanocephalus]|uniref:lymphokine-activated killer T-cell-originated protein kinase n=1 Tax=Malurus melanocephalus TaxID=175006 RepID=UPI00254819B4|nr:lymphokine-activated killer T-cell-originated protein kinase [Malurus melanocephalus]